MEYYNDIDIELKYKNAWQLDVNGNKIKQGDLLLAKNLYDSIKLSKYSIDLLSLLDIYEESDKKVYCNIIPFEKCSKDKLKVASGFTPLVNATLSKLFLVAEYFNVKGSEVPILFKHYPNSIYFRSEGISYGKLAAMLYNDVSKTCIDDDIGNSESRYILLKYVDCKALNDKSLESLKLFISKKKIKLLYDWYYEMHDRQDNSCLSYKLFKGQFIDWIASFLGVKVSDFVQEKTKISVEYSKTKCWKQTMKVLKGVLLRYSTLKKSAEFFSFHIQRYDEEIDKYLESNGDYSIMGGFLGSPTVTLDSDLQAMPTKNGRLFGFKVWAEHPFKKSHREFFFNQ